MAETRRKFDRGFREGAVRLVPETGKPIAQVARDLGINAGTLGNAQTQDRQPNSPRPDPLHPQPIYVRRLGARYPRQGPITQRKKRCPPPRGAGARKRRLSTAFGGT